MGDIPNRRRIEELVADLLRGTAGDIIILKARREQMSVKEINEVFRTAKARQSSQR